MIERSGRGRRRRFKRESIIDVQLRRTAVGLLFERADGPLIFRQVVTAGGGARELLAALRRPRLVS
jgi:hypothetical protein